MTAQFLRFRGLLLVMVFAVVASAPAGAQDDPETRPTAPVWARLNVEGLEHHAAGRLEAACSAFERALAAARLRDVDATEIRDNLVHTLIARAIVARDSGRGEDAERLLRAALGHDPASSSAWLWAGMLRQDEGLMDAAETALREAVRLDPESAAAHFQLGMVDYKRERLERAIESWERTLELDQERREAIEPWIEKARRELAIESTMQVEASSHFLCKFGDQLDRALVGEVLKMLERVYLESGERLQVWPREALTVILYPDREFGGATGANEWVGGLFDGKVRLPVRNWTRRKSVIEATLRHEYTHFLVKQITDTCPAWVNEGLAQIAEGATAVGREQELLKLEAAGRLLPLDELVVSFVRFADARQARLAYLQSLALVQYIEATYGVRDLVAVLRGVSRKNDFDEVFTRVFERTPDQMRAEWLRSIAD